jgi:hypothetical protein
MLMKEGQYPVALRPIRQRSHEVIQPARWRCRCLGVGARCQAFWKRSALSRSDGVGQGVGLDLGPKELLQRGGRTG